MAAAFDQAAQTGERLAPVRRTYLYIVAFVSLAATLAGIGSLVDTLARLWLGTAGETFGAFGYGRSVASSAGLLLVATPIFLVHWGLAQSRLTEASERASLLRKFFLYGASALSLTWLVVVAYALIQGIAALAFGQPLAQSLLWPAQWLSWIIMVAVNGALVAYWYAVLQSDGDFGNETRSGQIVRQIFMLFVGLAGLVLMLWGASGAAAIFLRLLVDATDPTWSGRWWQDRLADALTQLLLGGWLAYSNRAQWREIVAAHAQEGQTALRRLYLYAAVVIGAVATLTPAALLLRELLLMIFGDSTGALATLLDKLVTPLSFVPVGLTIWFWHWRILRQEANTYGESHEGATVRRLYYYLMAATGLALLWVGSVELLHALLDTLLTANSTIEAGAASVWHGPLANGLSLLAVGAPIWALHWRTTQRIAGETDTAGSAERAALPRKIYLYGVALVGALIILFQLAQVIYRLLLVLMGDASAPLVSTETAHQLADCLVAGIIWAVHLLALRGDTQREKSMPKAVETVQAAPAPDPTLQAADVTTAEEQRRLEEHRDALQAELAAVNRQLDALNAVR